MSNESDLETSEAIIRFPQEQGWSTEEIVRRLSGSLSYRKALEVAREWAPLLGLTVTEFMQMRKND
jgi:hypothetical protein